MKVCHLIFLLCSAAWPLLHAATLGHAATPGDASSVMCGDSSTVEANGVKPQPRGSKQGPGGSAGQVSRKTSGLRPAALQPSTLHNIAEPARVVPAIAPDVPDRNAIRRAVALEQSREKNGKKDQIRRVRLDDPISHILPKPLKPVGQTPTELRFHATPIETIDRISGPRAQTPTPALDQARPLDETIETDGVSELSESESTTPAAPDTSDPIDALLDSVEKMSPAQTPTTGSTKEPSDDLFDDGSLEKAPAETIPEDTVEEESSAETPATEPIESDAADDGGAVEESSELELPPLPAGTEEDSTNTSPSDVVEGELPPEEASDETTPKAGPRLPDFIQDDDEMSKDRRLEPRRRTAPPEPPASTNKGMSPSTQRPGGRAGIDPDFLQPPKQQPQAMSTISSLLADPDDQPDPCEPMWCEQMWQCAGGKNQSRTDIAFRNCLRTYQVTRSDRCCHCGGYTCNHNFGCNGRALSGPALGSVSGVGLWRDHFCNSGVPYGCHFNDGTIGGGVHGNANCSSLGCTVGQDNMVGYISDYGATTEVCDGGCGNSACQGGLQACHCGMSAGRPTPWTLWGLAWGCHQPAITVGGWTSAGYHSRADGLFNDHPHRLNIHQSAAYIQRTADTSRSPIDFGFRFDALYGVDAQNTQAFGNSPGNYDFQNGFDHGIFGWAFPQAYGEIAVNNASLMVGHFYTIMGYEVVAAPDNFFYSRSMTMNLSEPFTHTGALASWSPSQFIKYYSGWTMGWDTGFNHFQDASSYLGGFRLSLLDFLSASYTASAGDFGRRGEGYAHSVVFTTQLPNQWAYVLQNDVLRVGDEDNVGINQYLLFDVNRHLAVGSRLEWWKGDRVTAYAPYGSTLPAGGSFSYYGATLGANVRLGSNFVLRPEGRWDWSPGLDYSVGVGAVDMVMTY